MIVHRASPDRRLASIVRHYQARSGDLADTTLRVRLPARSEVLLEFYFSAPHLLEIQADRTLERAPQVAAVGPQTFRRVDLLLAGRMDIFTIHFTAPGLHLLTGVPMIDVTDAGVDASALFEAGVIPRLHQRLADAPDLATRVAIADTFLLERCAARQRPPRGDIVAASLARPGAFHPSSAGLSERQFRRLFEQQIGMAPKRHARILRLEAAIAAKTLAPGRSWTDIAHDCGYFDQAHMDKDFKALAGAPPSGWS